jgi:heptosyltransferase-3
MAESLKQRLKPFYRRRWLPFVRKTATLIFSLGLDLAKAVGIIQPAQPGDPESFLIINLAGHLGDAVMLLPMIEALRLAHPTARIELAVEAAAAPLFRHIAILDEVHALRLGSHPPTTLRLSSIRAAAILRAWWPMRHSLRPTTVILPRWGDDLFRSTTFAYLTQAPRRIGFASNVNPAEVPAPYRDALLTELVRGGSGMHEPARFVSLLEQANLIPLVDLGAVSTSPIACLAELAHSLDWPQLSTRLGLAPEQPFAVIAPGASMQRRVWPIANWLPIIEALAARGLKTILLAGPSDAATARQLQELAPSDTILAAGVTTLPESVTLIAHAAIFLGNDSGPGHLAGALAIPSIILFIAEPGCDPNLPAAPERVRPLGPIVQVLRPSACTPPCTGSCSAEEAHCIRTITPSALLPLLAASNSAPTNGTPTRSD